MREIEFRAKKTENGKWVYGYYHKLNESFENKDCILEHHRNTSTIIDITTLGQYTGLKDKNGTKIFEGDIVKTYHGNGKVVYSQQYALFGYIMLEKDNAEKEYDYRFTDVVIEDGIEVVGNIYDNPELLEVDNEN